MKERQHPTLDDLEDYVDGVLAPEEHEAVELHVSRCSECRTSRDRIGRLLRKARELPRTLVPPADVWPDVRAEIERRKQVVLPASGRAAKHARSHRTAWIWDHRLTLASAAMLLVLLSSGVTAVLMRGPGTGEIVSTGGPGGDAPGAVSVLPNGFAATETAYRRTIDDLRASFEAEREQLRPETVRTVERSLAVIDSAIVEARAALIADPGNRTIGDLLVASYQRKLDLLRQTSELTSRI